MKVTSHQELTQVAVREHFALLVASPSAGHHQGTDSQGTMLDSIPNTDLGGQRGSLGLAGVILAAVGPSERCCVGAAPLPSAIL